MGVAHEPVSRFYDVEATTVRVRSVGYKIHNDLYIRGKKVDL